MIIDVFIQCSAKHIHSLCEEAVSPIKPRLHDTTCCRTGCQPGKCLYTRYNRLSNQFHNWLYCVNKHSTGCQTRLTTGLTNGYVVYTAGCTTRFDNRLNEQWLFVQHG